MAVPGEEYSAEQVQIAVGFQALRCRTRLGVAPGTPARRVELLLMAAERSCVVLDTLRRGVDATSEFDVARGWRAVAIGTSSPMTIEPSSPANRSHRAAAHRSWRSESPGVSAWRVMSHAR